MNVWKRLLENVSLGLEKSNTINIDINKLIGLPIATSCKREKITTLLLFFAFFWPFIFVTRICRSNTTWLLWMSPLLNFYREINLEGNLSELETFPFSTQIFFLPWMFLMLLYYWIWTLTVFSKSRLLAIKWVFLEWLKLIRFWQSNGVSSHW